MLEAYVGLLLIFLMGLALVGGLLAAQLSKGTPPPAAEAPRPEGSRAGPLTPPDRRYAVRIYLVATLLVVFDVLAVYLYPLGAVFGGFGWYGLAVLVLCVVPLLVGLGYEWLKGALEW